ncbi:fumarate reductase flavoprotein subunit [Diplodia corticola]|uniref:Fumarate reductase flavoprotein subunit n=1 Tax=Diplodia corticola TaxID=236234 RepID=A0A1J9SDU6_9PEZI|nr:fumarate reductase flavoprotein subunit [Diplodia corticola]OJD38607.1 fumarate reductase flavoprotein subunit [Diplodia corticola]
MTPPLPPHCTVLVIGSGNAGLSAAISAAQNGAESVLLVDKCPPSHAGGNTHFTAGAYRTTHAGAATLLPLVNKNNNNNDNNNENNNDDAPATYSPEEVSIPPYPAAAFAADIARVTDDRADPSLAAVLVNDSLGAVRWLKECAGVRWRLGVERQAYRVSVRDGDGGGGGDGDGGDGDDGGEGKGEGEGEARPAARWRFWGGLALVTEGGGKGLVEDLLGAAARWGIRVVWGAGVVGLVVVGGGGGGGAAVDAAEKAEKKVVGAVLRHDGVDVPVLASGGVVLAAGGFEANAAMRARFLGREWGEEGRVRVRGTPFNTGEALEVAVRDAGAARAGDWAGCHAVAWDANAPRNEDGGGDRERTNEYTKSGYPLGVMVDVRGARFVDEGADFRNYTYARVGRAVLGREEGVAFQVWDAVGAGMLRKEEYREEVVERIEAGSLEELAERCEERGLRDPEAFVGTIRRFNEAATRHRERHPERVFNPAAKDGVATEPGMLDVPKSNWALPIEKPPFLAVKVGCGITFTFGGLAVEPETAAVMSESTGKPIDGLYAVGEMLGGLFYGNYPGGSGLTAGTVWGRRAGRDAAKRAQKEKGATRL